MNISSEEFYLLWDVQNEVGAMVSIPSFGEVDGATYLLVYLEDDFADMDEDEDPEEDGVCILRLQDKETPETLFEFRNADGETLGFAEEPEGAVLDKVTQMLLSNLNG